MTRKMICFILCIAFALAFTAVLAGCGEDKSKSRSQNYEKPSGDYVGVLEGVYRDEFTLMGSSGELHFVTDEETKYDFGEHHRMLVGDIISVKCRDDESMMVKKVTVLERTNAQANLGDFAAGLCWPYGESSKGRYDTGGPTEAYAALYDKIKPQEESGISSKQWRAGASCDLFVATALKGFGLTEFPVTLSRQCDYFFISEAYKDDFEKVETGGDPAMMQHGDVGIYIRADSKDNGQGHIFIVNKADGQNLKSNAHYRKDKGYYGVIDELKNPYDPGHYKYFGVFRLK